jgi:hypothetical protein
MKGNAKRLPKPKMPIGAEVRVILKKALEDAMSGRYGSDDDFDLQALRDDLRDEFEAI